MGMLVECGKLKCDKPAKELWDDFHVKDPTITKHTTMIDLLGHRSGLERLRAAVLSEEGFGYNDWGYEIADRILETLEGACFLQQLRISQEPLA
ncbi:hypothetical protein ONS95_005319 [Cadophora gregata]|uniref:uncharacterized protein n=1 Tax=Cadophora gregata TaxID=51156 RepID=UPI0026DC67AB|nr:uncharacterized protein ONS95_005319 [Cadophora gregata]KAK0103285.1 hypothetical protein ONS95_005319 [Cadophora gregata]KAK0107480.1 hypothetical protein ONS96_003293 [Cadophora gregata f. sp. sojae]